MNKKFSEFVGRKSYKEYSRRLLAATADYGKISLIGESLGRPLWKVVVNPEGEATLCFIAGLHGDEPAGPFGVLSFLENKIHVPATKKVVFIPLANPTGFEMSTRQSEEGRDINRHFCDETLTGECKFIWDALAEERIDLLHTLHEDPEFDKFYLYHTNCKPLCESIVNLASKHFRIYHEGLRYDDRVCGGLIPLPHVRRGTLEDRAQDQGIDYIATETPGLVHIPKRVDFTKNLVRLVINGM